MKTLEDYYASPSNESMRSLLAEIYPYILRWSLIYTRQRGLYHLDPADSASDTVLYLARKLADRTVQSEAHLKNLIKIVVKGSILTGLNRRHLSLDALICDGDVEFIEVASLEAFLRSGLPLMELEEIRSIVNAEIDKLPRRDRQLIKAVWVDGLSHRKAAIALKLKMKESQLEGYLGRLKVKLYREFCKLDVAV